MRVACSTTGREVELQERPDPVAGPGEVVLRVLACGVCGSDVSDAWVARKLPAVLGHELVGEVLAIGAGVSGLQPGQHVVAHHHAPCGTCRACRRGRETLCAAFRASALDPGGFAELVRVPADLTPELLDAGGLAPETALFTEPLACVLRALDRAGVQAGDRLLVVGAGVGGLLAIAAARVRGAERVWVAEPRADRLARAVELGAEQHGGEPADVALVCTPEPAAIRSGAAALGPGGVLGLYAPPKPGEPVDIDGFDLYLRELEIRPSYSAGPADMLAALALLRSGAIDPAPLVTHRLTLAQTAQALDLARSGAALKAVVLPTA